MNEKKFNQGLLDFLKSSPTPFHAVQWMAGRLAQAGFVRLFEADPWDLNPGRYYVIRNDSAVIAFILGKEDLPTTGIRMVGSHTDSPCLKVKPLPDRVQHSYLQLGVEVYGGALLTPWFDRDLSLAGRVTYLSSRETLQTCLVDFKEPVAVIPSLAIHFDREVNKGRAVNPQDELLPVLLQLPESEQTRFSDILLSQLKTEHPDADVRAILAHEICLYDVQPPCLVGLNQEFICGARLDNLLSCYIGLMALTDADPGASCLLVCNDHEEVGSVSAAGAQGPFLTDVMDRLCSSPGDRVRTLQRSLMVSADDAHGLHPNYAKKYDDNHGPILNKGPVIKINAGQRYASDSQTAGFFRYLCQQAHVPVQAFVMRSDLACGSTIGPLTAAQAGIKVVDVGVPIWAMHSIRETAGRQDGFYLYRVLKKFMDFQHILPDFGDSGSP